MKNIKELKVSRKEIVMSIRNSTLHYQDGRVKDAVVMTTSERTIFSHHVREARVSKGILVSIVVDSTYTEGVLPLCEVENYINVVSITNLEELRTLKHRLTNA